MIENQKLFDLDNEVKDKTDTELAGIFTDNCSNSSLSSEWRVGLCSTSSTEEPAWQRVVSNVDIMSPCGNSLSYKVNGDNKGVCSSSKVVTGDVAWADPRYIIELLSPAGADERVYRITVRAWGKNKSVSSTIQSYFSISG